MADHEHNVEVEPAPFDPGIPTSRRPRLAVFGGSFDPVHNGHLFLAGEVLRCRKADEVLFVPARRPPHKVSRALSSSEHRLTMLTAATAPYPQFSVSDIELTKAAGLSYTFETLDTLRQCFPEHEIAFLMGMDSLRDLHTWFRAAEIVSRYEFIVYPRPGVLQPSFATLAGDFGNSGAAKLTKAILDLPRIPVGATRVRGITARNGSLAGFLPDSVLDYIRRHSLYAKPHSPSPAKEPHGEDTDTGH